MARLEILELVGQRLDDRYQLLKLVKIGITSVRTEISEDFKRLLRLKTFHKSNMMTSFSTYLLSDF